MTTVFKYAAVNTSSIIFLEAHKRPLVGVPLIVSARLNRAVPLAVLNSNKSEMYEGRQSNYSYPLARMMLIDFAKGGTYYFLLCRSFCSTLPFRISPVTRSQLVISLAFEVDGYNVEKIFILNRFFVCARYALRL